MSLGFSSKIERKAIQKWNVQLEGLQKLYLAVLRRPDKKIKGREKIPRLLIHFFCNMLICFKKLNGGKPKSGFTFTSPPIEIKQLQSPMFPLTNKLIY
jgi:hypothetical protein